MRTETGAPPVVSRECSFGDENLLSGDTCYTFVDQGLTWTQARNYCEGLGAHLVSIQTGQDNNNVQGLATPTTVWTGLSRTVEGAAVGPWTWEEGQGATSNLTYINWDETMPCSDADIVDNTGDCGECVNMDATGEWFSHNCDDLHSFVCEYTWDLGEEGTTTVSNTAPEVLSLDLESVLSTTPFNTEDTVQVLFSTNDTDGDALSTKFVWYVNGVPVEGEDSDMLTGDYFVKGDEVTVQVMALDGADFSAPETIEFTVVNTVPKDPEIFIDIDWAVPANETEFGGTTGQATEMDDLGGVVSSAAADLDPDVAEGTDSLFYTYTWSLDGIATSSVVDKQLDPSETSPGDIWTLTIFATDEENASSGQVLDAINIVASGQTCQGAIELVTGDSVPSTTFEGSNSYEPKVACSEGACTNILFCQPGSSLEEGDRFFSYTPGTLGTITATVVGSNQSSIAYVKGCGQAAGGGCEEAAQSPFTTTLEVEVADVNAIETSHKFAVEANIGKVDNKDFTFSITFEERACGNGALDPGEFCDDGNYDNNDGCDFDCVVECAIVEPTCADDGVACTDTSCDPFTIGGCIHVEDDREL